MASIQAPSPVRNGGRGLKLCRNARLAGLGGPSPVRNGGRGLKLAGVQPPAHPASRRPSEMAGVD